MVYSIGMVYSKWCIPNAKQTLFAKHNLPELAEALHLRPWKILLFSETKWRKPQRCTWEGHLKNKRETNIASNILNLVVLHDLSLVVCSTHFHCLYKWQKKITFLDQWNWIVDCPVNSRKLQKYFQQYIKCSLNSSPIDELKNRCLQSW